MSGLDFNFKIIIINQGKFISAKNNTKNIYKFVFAKCMIKLGRYNLVQFVSIEK